MEAHNEVWTPSRGQACLGGGRRAPTFVRRLHDELPLRASGGLPDVRGGSVQAATMHEGQSGMPFGLLLSTRETIQARAVQSVAGGILAELSGTSPSVRRSKALYDRPRDLPSDEEGSGMRRLPAQIHRRILGNGYCPRPVEMDCHFDPICEFCNFFVTTIGFRAVLEKQRDDAANNGEGPGQKI
jgi:hypothetical protein